MNDVAALAKVFRDRVRQELDDREWSQRDLSRAMGLSPNYVGRFLSTENVPGLDVIERVAKAFEIEDPLELLKPKDTSRELVPVS